MIRAILKSPYAVIVLVLVTAVLGLTVLQRMPIDILPQFKTPAVQIVTLYPGMPAEVVEQDMTSRLERWTGQSVGIEHQESRSMLGVSIVKDFFREDIDPNSAISQVTSYAMSDLYYLPPGTVPPMVMPFDPTAGIPLCLLSVSSATHDETTLYDIAYFQLRNRLQGISGVVAPAVYGGKLRRILAYVDREKLESKSLSPRDVVTALQSNSVFIPVGSARLGRTEYQLDTNALPPTVEEMNAFPLKTHNGSLAYLRDVGDVQDSAEIQSNLVRVDGRRQVYIPIYRQPGANTIVVVQGVQDQIDTLKTQLPAGVNLDVVFDQSVYVKQSIRALSVEAILGGLLAALMILVFLASARSTLFILLTLPLSILAALIGLYATGQTINTMTLGGLALATGLILDEGIVAIENIVRHLEMGKKPFDAALDGMREVGRPRLLIALTVMVVFFPVVFLAGLAKFLFAPLAIAVAFAMAGSYLFSMTVVPLCASRFLRARGADAQRPALAQFVQRGFEGLQRRYANGVRAMLRHKTLALAATGALLAAVGFLLLPRIGSELFPAVDAGQLMIRVRAPTGTDLKRTEAILVDVEKAVQAEIPKPVLSKLITNIGVLNDWPAAYTPNAGPGDAFVLIQLAEGEGRKPVSEYVERLRTRLNHDFPGIEFAFDTGGMLTAAVNLGAASPIDVQVQGKNLAVAQDLARELRRRIAAVPGAVDVRVQQRLDAPQYRIEVDREKAALPGLDAEDAVKNVITAFTSSVLAHDGRTQATEGNFLDVTKQSAFAGAALTAEWEVGEAVYATLAARQRTCASVAAEEAGGEDAALKAGEAYLDLVRAEASLAVAKDAVDLSQRIAKETEDKVGAGSGFAGDVLRAKAQLAHDRATVSLAAEARRTSAVRLAEILNLPPEVDLVPRDAIPIRFTLVAATDPEAMLIRDALLSRADVREADALACAADKERDAARYAPLVPRVGVEASAGGLGRTYGDLSSSDDLRITLGWTIGSGGLFDTGRIAEADSRYRLASITSSRVRARVVREVREAYAMLSERARAIGSAEQGARDATEALDLYRKRLTGAVGLPLEVVVAQETLTRARLDWIEATVGYDKAQLRLLRALGGDRISAGR